MASRRTRIKGIAVIPQRKKDSVVSGVSSDIKKDLTEENSTVITNNKNDSHDSSIAKNQTFNDSYKDVTTNQVDQDLEPKQSPKSPIAKGADQLTNNVDTTTTTVLENETKTEENTQERKDSSEPDNSTIHSNTDILNTNNADCIIRSNKKINILQEVRLPRIPTGNAVCDLTKILAQSPHSEINLHDSHETMNKYSPQLNNSSVLAFSPTKKPYPEVQYTTDAEYPIPPPSPSKFNRSRIKPAPKLSGRKTSCSASESEDEYRKYGRIRNNSVCSTSSVCVDQSPISLANNEIPYPREESPKMSSVSPKKAGKVEQSRKLAEARREFNRQFGSNKPDRQNLKMIHLIFYDPPTNPMSKKDEAKKNIDKNTSVVDDPPEAEEEHDEEQEKESDSENNSLVPQIRVGESGEIVLDERSLFVESTVMKNHKKNLEKSVVIDGDAETSYGVYKRATRASYWTKQETLRFYKALNVLGTDFNLMTQLFPKRTRRELKIKFKKEEKLNRPLIDKAIREPCNYNLEDLKQDMELEEEETQFLKMLEEEEKAKRLQKKREKKRKPEIIDLNEKDVEDDPPCNLPFKKRQLNEDQTEKPCKRLKRLGKQKSLSICSVLDDDDADDEEEFIPFLKPTRSGRMPKSTLKFNDLDDLIVTPKRRIYKKVENLNSIIDMSSREKIEDALRNRESFIEPTNDCDLDKLVPGSTFVSTEEGPNGEICYKVFMVTPEKKLMPLELESDVIASLVKAGEELEFTDVAPPLENNITIPATSENKQ